jgi:hypothetical protein
MSKPDFSSRSAGGLATRRLAGGDFVAGRLGVLQVNVIVWLARVLRLGTLLSAW